MSSNEFFERCHCVNLDRRPDRWHLFQSGMPPGWPFPPVERFRAADGVTETPPPGWPHGPGAWGCYLSHRRLLSGAARGGTPSLLVLEDDVVFVEDFPALARAFLASLPRDWGAVYLGGEHTCSPEILLTELYEGCPGILRPWGVRRTHAYGLRGPALAKVARWLELRTPEQEVDDELWRALRALGVPTYCPTPWLAGQSGSPSDISPAGASSGNFWHLVHG
jgi:hypothetical protein